MFCFDDCVCDDGSKELDCADSVVVAGDNVVNEIGIAVGVYDCNDGDIEFASFFDCVLFFFEVDDEQAAGQSAHIFDTAEVLLEIVTLFLESGNFFLGEKFELADEFHLVDFVQAIDSGTDGLEVG